MVGVGGRSYATRCHVCRRRKVKCDGQKPSCQRCAKAGLTCTGYERSLEFAFFDGQSMVKVKPETNMKPTTPAAYLYQTTLKVEEASTPTSHNEVDAHCTDLVSENTSVGRALAVSQYKVSFVAVLQDRYVPDLPKIPNQTEGICSAWIATACDLSSLQGSDMLSDSLLAMSLALVAGERNDPDIATAGLHHYSRALKRLRIVMQPGPLALGQYQLDVSLVTCLACATYEMIAHQSLETIVQHLQGICILFNLRGAENLRSPTSRKIFYEYRVIEMTVSLAARRASFLSEPQWLSPPWTADPYSLNPLQMLIDSAILLPALMEKWDKTTHKMQNAGVNVIAKNRLVDVFVQDALRIKRAINDWESNLRGGDDKSQLYIAHLSNSKISLQAEDSGKVFPISYTFPSFEIAAAVVYYETVHIFLNSFLIELISYAQNSGSFPNINRQDLVRESLECADRICQSLEYFFQRDKRMIGRIVILSPFEAVRALFARLLRTEVGDADQIAVLVKKLTFCETISKRIKAEGLLLWDGTT